MKKIVNMKPPTLERIDLQIGFPQDITLKISEGSKIYAIVAHHDFNKEPSFALLPPLVPGQDFQLPLSQGLTFLDEDKNAIIIGRNTISFLIIKYPRWKDLLPRIVGIITELKDILKLERISKVSMNYIDKLETEREGFVFREYFNLLFSKNDGGWNIQNHDIFLGFVPEENEEKKIIMRLRGFDTSASDPTIYRFFIETQYLNKKKYITLEDFGNILDSMHSEIVKYFIDLLEHTKFQTKYKIEIEDN